MKKLYLFSLLQLTISLPVHLYAQSSCVPVALQCENLVNPLGIDAGKPRLSWRLEDKRTGATQTACQIFIGTDSLQVALAKGNNWQTGKMNSSKQAVIYNGKTLVPFTKYFWTVRVWDKDARQSLRLRDRGPVRETPCLLLRPSS